MPLSKDSARKLLLDAHRAGRLPHAHLFTGPSGCGKSDLARELAAAVLGCEPSSVLAHPDAHFVQPESKSRRIVIDQIRGLDLAIQRKPLVSSSKVAILHDAERLQPAAANAFLKTLEEPPPGTVIILTSSLPEALLETIISRCVETSLAGGSGNLTPDAARVVEALGECLLREGGPAVADAFRLAAKIKEILGEVRGRISDEYLALLKQEAARYKNAAGAGDWLEERENQIKALTESAALRERERLIGAILAALGGTLRLQAGGEAPAGAENICRRLAETCPPERLLRKIDAFEAMQRRLAMNVNEALALESGMLAIAKS